MMTNNQFAVLSETVPSVFLQGFVITMLCFDCYGHSNTNDSS